MGDFNPHMPQILGQEWVPIREEITEFSPVVNAVEYGTGFTIRSTVTADVARFYTNDWMNQPLPLTSVSYQTIGISIYPQGDEALSGPVERIVIPCNNGGVTGANTALSDATMAISVGNPGRPGGVTWSLGTATGTAAMYFNMQPYLAALKGKRILGVNVLYGARYNPSTTLNFTPTFTWSLVPALNTGLIQRYVNSDWTRFDSNANTLEQFEVFRVKLGEINPFHNGTPGSGILFPWLVQELNRLDFSQINPVGVQLSGALPGAAASFVLTYVALEIIYCEEQRVAVGITQTNVNGLGPVVLQVRTILGGAGKSLTPGNYTLAVYAPDRGDGGGGSTLVTPFPPVGPTMNALRELYSIPAHLGYTINHPFPVDDTIVGQEFSVEANPIHTQVALFGLDQAVLNEVMPYGRQAAAEVWGSITARQTIQDYTPNATAMGSAEFPYVRFYARRFGQTQVPLVIQSSAPSISGLPNSAWLTPDEFDALEPEGGIIDGWKEVTLQFETAPVMGTGIWPEWFWSASGEDPGNRWEILGATAPDVSGAPGNLLQPGIKLWGATYGSPPLVSGGTVNLTWLPQWNPPTSSIVADPASDAVLMFSQYPPAVTGLGVTQLAFPVTGIGDGCGDNCCIPTSILYNKVAWSVPLPIIGDHFDRVSSPGLGTYRGSIAWSTTSGTDADWTTNGTSALYHPSTASTQLEVLATSLDNSDVTVQVTFDDLSASSTHHVGLISRYLDTSNYYVMNLQISRSTKLGTLSFDARVGGSTTTTSGATVPYLWDTTDGPITFKMRMQTYNRNVRFKVWQDYDEEPDWQMQVVDSGLTAAGNVGIRTIITTSDWNFYNFTVVPTGLVGSVYELQRSDEVDDWATIMRASNLATNSFNDYEARVSLESSYRIRTLNLYEFEGQWSSTALGTIQSPGVSGGPCLDGSGVLIFTSNYDQSGNSNLAYVEAYEGRPEQAFGFPEANTLQLQRMYRRNFQVAFKGTERGGEAFTRMILVQNAVISPPRLANMRDLRDMAWAQLPYVAVRDDIGDRWLSAVSVPTNKVWKRKIYLANIGVVEVTNTPYPVDP